MSISRITKYREFPHSRVEMLRLRQHSDDQTSTKGNNNIEYVPKGDCVHLTFIVSIKKPNPSYE